METTETDSIWLLRVLGTLAPTSSAYQDRLASQLQTEHLPAKHYLIRAGEICRRLYFIKCGLIRSYHIDELGNQCTNWFLGAGDLAIAITSFYDQRPSAEYLEVLIETEVQSITWEQLNALYADFEEANLIGRLITQKYFVKSSELYMKRHTPSITARYINLIQQYPDIEQLTTQANIASYLGITRETLNRLKREQLKQGRNRL